MSPEFLRRYVHGPGADEPITWYEGSGLTLRNYLVADEKGSITAVTDHTGAASNLNTYDEYGRPGSTNAGRFQYTGQTWLADVGLYYYKARIYSPSLGRFMQTDPVGYGAGLNLYAYVGNDPANNVDSSGLAYTDVWTWFTQGGREVTGSAYYGGYYTAAGVSLSGAEPGHTGPGNTVDELVITLYRDWVGGAAFAGLSLDGGGGGGGGDVNCQVPPDEMFLGNQIDQVSNYADATAFGTKAGAIGANANLAQAAETADNFSTAVLAFSEGARFINSIQSGVSWDVAAADSAGRVAGDVAWYGAGTLVGAGVGAAAGAPFAGVGAGPGAGIGARLGGPIGATVGNIYQGPGSVSDFGRTAARAVLKLKGCN